MLIASSISGSAYVSSVSQDDGGIVQIGFDVLISIEKSKDLWSLSIILVADSRVCYPYTTRIYIAGHE